MRKSIRVPVIAFGVLLLGASASFGAAPDRWWKQSGLVESHTGGSPDAPLDSQTPQLAVARNGNAVAVWVLTDHENGRVMASRYTARDKHWTDATPIDAGTANAGSPQVALDALGNAMIVWSEPGAIRARSYAPDGTLGPIASLQSVSGSSASPQVAFGPDGNAIAVWHQSDASHSQIWANRFTANNWTGAVAIEENPGDAVLPQIAVGAGGNAVVVWQQTTTGSHTDIWENRYVAGQGWSSAAARPIENNDGNAFAPQVAIDATGNARAIWFEFDTQDGRNRVWSSRYALSSNQWSAATAIESNTGSATDPRVALDANGNAVAVWMQVGKRPDNSSVISIWSNRSATGSDAWDTAVLLETDDTGDARAPSIAMDAAGNALAVWHQIQPQTGVFGIWAARYTPAATLQVSWATAVLVEPLHAVADALLARVGFDANGNALAVWSRLDARPEAQHFIILFDRYAKPDVLGHFAYVPNGHIFQTYNINPSTGQLTQTNAYNPGAGTVYASAVIDSSGQFAYVQEALGIDYFRIDATTGLLTRLGGIGFGVTPFEIITEPTGHFLYVSGGSGVITYTVNPTTHMPLPTSELSISFPGKPDIEPSGRFLYLPITGAIAIYSITATNGTLIDTGRRLMVGNVSTSIRIAPGGKFAYVSKFDTNTVTPYAIDAVTGDLTAVGPAVTTGNHPYRIAVDPLEQFVYVANRGSGDVSAFAINPSTGALSAVPGSLPPAGTNPDDIRVDPSGLFVYVSNFTSKDVVTFSINPVTGALTRRSALTTSPLNNSSSVFIRILPVLESPPCPPQSARFTPRPNVILCGPGSF